MNTLIGLLIIAVGSFGQSSSYVPINRVKGWSWENFWLVQGIFAWLVFPLLGALLAIPADGNLIELPAGMASNAPNNGKTSHAKIPCTSQKLSHDQFFTLLMGTYELLCPKLPIAIINNPISVFMIITFSDK